MSKMIRIEWVRSGVRTSALALFACACTGETVDLGELSRDFSAASRCRESTTIDGNVVVADQEQLDALQGCEVIEGNLHVRPFDGADLRPLSALTRVGGAIEFGRFTALDTFELPPEVQERIDEIWVQEQALIEAGWLASLEGLESLERAGSLLLRGLGAPSLAPLSNLSALTHGGRLALGPCTSLSDLSGLDSLVGVVELDVQCDSLVSLSGLRFATRMGDVTIRGANLTDLADFAPESARDLSISYTALESLDALAQLSRVVNLDLFGNPSLVDASALSTLNLVKSLRIVSNPALASLPELTALAELDILSITNNAALTHFPVIPNLGLLGDYDDDWGNLDPVDALRVRPDIIDVTSNPALESISIPPGWLAVGYLTISGNPNLGSVDLTNLHAADGLYLAANPALASVSLGKLQTADDLRVIDNPLLPLEPFDAVQSYNRVLRAGPVLPEQEEGF